MSEITARGFAIVIDGILDMRTVYPHARGAVVNWLSANGVEVLNDWPDDKVWRVWNIHREDAEVLPVKVTVMRSATDD